LAASAPSRLSRFACALSEERITGSNCARIACPRELLAAASGAVERNGTNRGGSGRACIGRGARKRPPEHVHKALEIVGVHGFASPVLQWWRRTSSRVASREAGRPRRLEHSCRGCQDGLVTYGVGWLQRHLAAGRRHQHSCVSRSGDLPTTSASTHTRSHPQSRRISPAYLRHAFRTRGELPTAPI
jgi:hypothetical protein